MSTVAHHVESFLARAPAVGALLYVALISLCGLVILVSGMDIAEHRQALATAASVLEKFESRKMPSRPSGDAGSSPSSGSPLIEGATVTLAGAALLQRVVSAIARYGGNTLSSQLELNGSRSKAGFISVIVTFDIDQGGLQKLLYDVEAGMPFLFVDRLVAQAEVSSVTAPAPKLRLLLDVSGQWEGAK
jgi:general secretion pathway protein M